ncbi:MAG: signal recognition particle protein [Spirochaetes bacterium]|nr:signal recognition particle protein [Spirochaetota bacterium]
MLDRFSKKISELVKQISGKSHISDKNIRDAINEIKIALLEADVNIRVVRRFVNRTAEEALGEKILKSVSPGQQFIKILNDKLVQLLGDTQQGLVLKGTDTVTPLLMVGLQGSGKTTTAVKIGDYLKRKGRNVLLVAADLVRPAAVEQLTVLGNQAGIEVYKEDSSKPQKVVKNALKYAKKNQFDTIIVDTSGRLHIDENMMAELSDIKKVLDPDEILLVADAMTGQTAVDIAKSFNERLSLSGIVLSKFDSDTRGGAALSIKSITGKPIKFIGTGEKIEDLELFYPDRMASRILGMGDVVTLVEKAQETIQLEEAEELQRKIETKTFTLQDYLDQFKRLKKMGSLQSIAEMIPGMNMTVNENAIDETEIKREEAIILSMTKVERNNYRIISPRRRKRIARGSGTSVFEVNRLLKKYDKLKTMMKKMAKNKKYQSKMLAQFGKN